MILNDVMPSGPTPHSSRVEIGLAVAERRHGHGDRRVFVLPVEPGAGQETHHAAIEPRVHAVAVEFDFVQPTESLRRRVD